ncbi:MAG: hypothetical protein OXG15_00665 [Gammaproteobacteria bacterium]|nr:hypothetical protein [Gammaproteobacteria bacterium]
MTSIAVLRWRRDQKVPLVLPVFVFWPIMIVLLIVGLSMQLGSTRWVRRGKQIVLLTRIVGALRGVRISLRDDETLLDISVL